MRELQTQCICNYNYNYTIINYNYKIILIIIMSIWMDIHIDNAHYVKTRCSCLNKTHNIKSKSPELETRALEQVEGTYSHCH